MAPRRFDRYSSPVAGMHAQGRTSDPPRHDPGTRPRERDVRVRCLRSACRRSAGQSVRRAGTANASCRRRESGSNVLQVMRRGGSMNSAHAPPDFGPHRARKREASARIVVTIPDHGRAAAYAGSGRGGAVGAKESRRRKGLAAHLCVPAGNILSLLSTIRPVPAFHAPTGGREHPGQRAGRPLSWPRSSSEIHTRALLALRHCMPGPAAAGPDLPGHPTPSRWIEP
ncbi:MAG: hypothetical protein JWM27_660 [Gemmatimonadetes bacterium]|nr:hypothetical protein [Gemmatimonadota bacterium]